MAKCLLSSHGFKIIEWNIKINLTKYTDERSHEWKLILVSEKFGAVSYNIIGTLNDKTYELKLLI